MDAVPPEFIHTARTAADAARVITMRHFRAPLKVDRKRDRSPVTRADHETEARLRALILERHPSHGFLGEESGRGGTADGEWCWVIDPIDGTKSFASGHPCFGTLITLLYHDRPVLGIIDHAALNERWVGIRGRRTTHNDAPCTTNAARHPRHGSLYTTAMDGLDADAWQRFRRLSDTFRFRVFGGDCYAYGLLASGFTEAVCEAGLAAHDYLALVPVVEGAGGVISDWRGDALTVTAGKGRVLAAANAELHRAALACLQAGDESTGADTPP